MLMMVFILSTIREDAVKLAQDIKKVHSMGGFNMRNWRSNSHKVVMAMSESIDVDPIAIPFDGTLALEKVLGMFWCISSDSLIYSTQFNKGGAEVIQGIRSPTKREVLKTLASIYDPVGLISHLTVGIKLILRETWIENLKWDDQLAGENLELWRKWLKQFHDIQDTSIPRCLKKSSQSWDECSSTLHTFSDAGENAYCAAVYLRMKFSDHVEVKLVAAKSRPAPLSWTSIPRLELQAALIGVRLYDKVKESLTIPVQQSQFYSDSTTVLDWLESRKRLPIWIAFRVGEIREKTPLKDWRYVPTKQNPADDGSKWRENLDLTVNSRWFQGPKFLLLEQEHWPSRPSRSKTTDPTVIVAVTINTPM